MGEVTERTKKNAAREAYQTFSGIGAVVSAHQASGKITEFKDDVRTPLREALHKLVDHLVDDIEAYEFTQMGGSALAGHNALGQAHFQPVQAGKLQCNSGNFELVVKAQSPAPEESELVVPKKRLI